MPKLLYWQATPTFTFVAPPDATKVAGTTVAATTTAVGATGVRFYLDGQFIGEGTEVENRWEIPWNTALNPDGVQTLVAVVTGGLAEPPGDAILVGVNNGGTVTPSVRIVEPYYDPSEGRPVYATVPLTLVASAADLGLVSGVEFYYAGSWIGNGSPGPLGWTLIWDSFQTQSPDGTANLTAVAIGADGSRGTSQPIPVTVDNKTIHVGDLDGTSSRLGQKWSAQVTVTVHNAGHYPLPGATVSGTWSIGGGTASLVTDSNGQCRFTSRQFQNKSTIVTFTVTAVTVPKPNPAGLHYNASLNHDPDGDSSGTSIIVPRP